MQPASAAFRWLWFVALCRFGKRTDTEEAHKALAYVLHTKDARVCAPNIAMGFIDPSLLESEDTDHFTCSICMQLLDTPSSPSGCKEGHVFCAACLRDALKATPRCPTCRADSSPDALTRSRPLETVINGLRLRCAHGAAPPSAEPDAKRQKKDEVVEIQKGAVVAASSCSWRGKVADYQAHLAECLFEPHSCKECGAMVAKRDDARHAVVCTVTCPFFGCGHKCPRAQMAQHHVDAADEHARAATAEISALKESSAAATRRIKELEDLSQWTVVDVDFRLKANDCFTIPATGVKGAASPWFPVWGGLNLRFRWLSYAPDARGINGMPPGHCYCVMADLTKEACDGVEVYGKVAACDATDHVTGPFLRWGCGTPAEPHKFSSTERNGDYFSNSLSITDSAADNVNRAKITQPDGTIHFMGRYWLRDSWRQSYLGRGD